MTDHTTMQQRGCPVCGDTVTGLARLTKRATTAVLERFPASIPPGPLPDGAVEVVWLADPCWHTLTPIETWDAVIDLGWGEQVAMQATSPPARQQTVA